jgi:hypothetical protein
LTLKVPLLLPHWFGCNIFLYQLFVCWYSHVLRWHLIRSAKMMEIWNNIIFFSHDRTCVTVIFNVRYQCEIYHMTFFKHTMQKFNISCINMSEEKKFKSDTIPLKSNNIYLLNISCKFYNSTNKLLVSHIKYDCHTCTIMWEKYNIISNFHHFCYNNPEWYVIMHVCARYDSLKWAKKKSSYYYKMSWSQMMNSAMFYWVSWTIDKKIAIDLESTLAVTNNIYLLNISCKFYNSTNKLVVWFPKNNPSLVFFRFFFNNFSMNTYCIFVNC